MIDHDKKVVFVRVARTASTTFVRTFARGELDLKPVAKTNWWYDSNHLPLWWLMKHHPEIETYFKFAIVRNPYTRLVSAFHYDYDWYTAHAKKYDVPLTIPGFRQWVRDLIWGKDEHTKSKYIDQYKQVKGCDYVGKFETLEQDYVTICEHMKISVEPLHEYNKSENFFTKNRERSQKLSTDHKEYYDDQLLDDLKPHINDDLIQFGYTFD